MKKVVLILVAMLGISFAVNAQSCKISGSEDGSTVMVTNSFQEGSKIVVNLENDSEKTCANVTVEVEVSYAGNNKKTYTGYGKSCPGSSCKIDIPIDVKVGKNDMKGFSVKKVSGNKCN